MPKISKITCYEREQIELYLKMGKSRRWIGKRLCREYTGISREVKRNSGDYLPYQYERKTMLCRLNKLKNKEAAETENAIAESVESLPNGLWQSIALILIHQWHK